MSNTKSVKIKEYDWAVFFTMALLVILWLYFLFSFITTWKEMLRVAQTVEYGNDLTTLEWSKVLESISVTETNRYYDHIINLRKNKLEKLNYWSKKEKTEILTKYKNFYDLQISKNWVLDYHQLASEIAWIWNKLWIKILGISLGTPRLSWNVQFSGDSRYQIYERPVTIDIAKKSDTWFEKNSVADYEKLKSFLSELRNDVKMPFNAWFEVSKQNEKEDGYVEWGIKLDRVNLLFFYNHKK